MNRETKTTLEKLLNGDFDFRSLFPCRKKKKDDSVYKVVGQTLITVCSHCDSRLLKVKRIAEEKYSKPDKTIHYYCPNCKNLR